MRFVRRLRTLELPLRDITQIVALRTAGQAPCAVVRDALARELEAIEDRIDQLRKLGEELSRLQHEAGQVQGQVLSSALDQAVEDGLLVRNPAKQVKGPKVRPRRQLFLQADEVERLATAAEDRQRGAGTLVQFLGYSGLRWGEAVALRASSVDLAGGRVEVAEAATEINGRLVFGLPKTHEKRTVYLAPRFVVDRLGELIGDGTGMPWCSPPQAEPLCVHRTFVVAYGFRPSRRLDCPTG